MKVTEEIFLDKPAKKEKPKQIKKLVKRNNVMLSMSKYEQLN